MIQDRTLTQIRFRNVFENVKVEREWCRWCSKYISQVVTHSQKLVMCQVPSSKIRMQPCHFCPPRAFYWSKLKNWKSLLNCRDNKVTNQHFDWSWPITWPPDCRWCYKLFTAQKRIIRTPTSLAGISTLCFYEKWRERKTGKMSGCPMVRLRNIENGDKLFSDKLFQKSVEVSFESLKIQTFQVSQ